MERPEVLHCVACLCYYKATGTLYLLKINMPFTDTSPRHCCLNVLPLKNERLSHSAKIQFSSLNSWTQFVFNDKSSITVTDMVAVCLKEKRKKAPFFEI